MYVLFLLDKDVWLTLVVQSASTAYAFNGMKSYQEYSRRSPICSDMPKIVETHNMAGLSVLMLCGMILSTLVGYL